MLTIYIVCLSAGAVVLAASVWGGHAGDTGGDTGGDLGGGHDVDGHTGDASSGPAGHHELLGRLPFLSLRFWTWAATFFGLAGTVLTLGKVTSALVPWLAGITGAGVGWGASYLLRRLTRDVVGVLPDADSHVGRQGKLLLPLRRGVRSKMRLSVGGTDTDLLVETDSEDQLAAGELVLIVGMRGMTALVERLPAVLTPVADHESNGSDEEET